MSDILYHALKEFTYSELEGSLTHFEASRLCFSEG